MKRLAALREEVSDWQILHQHLKDALELAQFEDESLRSDLEREVAAIESTIAHHEFEAMLSGKYDRGNAILAIHAGAGGTDSQDWAEMLERMYLRWAETKGYQTEILDFTSGEEAGVKSITIAIEGRYAYGYLRPERCHRLVRLSPFDAAHRRHTSFALVKYSPDK
jgi:peptide chain release factor 2